MALRRWISLALLAACSALVGPAAQAQETGTKVHALTLNDAPKYGPDFKHLDYVNPDAPKGGSVNFEASGTYDSFNPFIIKGTPAGMPGLFETLTTRTDDDDITGYALIAESMEVAPDRSWVIFNLRPEARWHDGTPITADDVVFSLDALKQYNPLYRTYFAEVTKAEKLAERRVKFSFESGGNRELSVIVGELPILPKHWWKDRKFDSVLLEPPLGSGPYKVVDFELGRSYALERVADYWGKDLPVRIGTNNYDRIRYVYYRDRDVSMEAFKSGAIDFRQENQAKRWATGYDFPAVKDGRVKKELVLDDNPVGMQGYVMNLRRPVFQDRRVREAMILAFDFEWSNKTLFNGLYHHSRSYYGNSEMEAKGLPSPEELELLTPLKGQIPDEVFTTEYNPPKTDGSGNPRENLEKAAKLLDEAGWVVVDGKRVKDGQPMTIEFLIDDPAFERVTQPYIQNLRRLGIDAKQRTVDSAQYQEREENRDYDIITNRYGQTLSPGNEQREFWGSKAADDPGSQNFMGIKNPAIDQLISQLINSPTREDLIIRCRALDRVLQWNYYMIPHWHLGGSMIAYWDKFGVPSKRPEPLHGLGTGAWWVDPAQVEALKTRATAATQGAETAETETTGQDQSAAAESPAPAATQGGTDTPAAERGTSPIVYGAGAVIVVLAAYLLGRRRAKKS